MNKCGKMVLEVAEVDFSTTIVELKPKKSLSYSTLGRLYRLCRIQMVWKHWFYSHTYWKMCGLSTCLLFTFPNLGLGRFITSESWNLILYRMDRTDFYPSWPVFRFFTWRLSRSDNATALWYGVTSGLYITSFSCECLKLHRI